MSNIITFKTVSGKTPGRRGVQGLQGNNPPLGPQGIPPQGFEGDQGTPRADLLMPPRPRHPRNQSDWSSRPMRLPDLQLLQPKMATHPSSRSQSTQPQPNRL